MYDSPCGVFHRKAFHFERCLNGGSDSCFTILKGVAPHSSNVLDLAKAKNCWAYKEVRELLELERLT